MSIQVPERHKAGLRDLMGVTPADGERFTNAMSIATPVLDPRQLGKHLASHVGIDQGQASRIVFMLVSLYLVKQDTQSETFVRDLCEDLKRSGDPKLTPGDGDWERFAAFVDALLACDSLGITAKAFDVTTEYERAFCHVRLLTDLRPVFGVDPSARPRAVAVVHQLKIAYHEDGRHKDFYVAMNSDDLTKLAKAVGRAAQKEGTVRTVLSELGLHFLKLESDPCKE